MANGPCLCGDPACPHCGNPQFAEIEAAEEQMLDRLASEKLAAYEYRIVLEAGLAALKVVREINVAENMSALDHQLERLEREKEIENEN